MSIARIAYRSESRHPSRIMIVSRMRPSYAMPIFTSTRLEPTSRDAREGGDPMHCPTDTDLYRRGCETLLASWEEYARGAFGAAVIPGRRLEWTRK